MSDLFKERVLLALALLLCVTVSLLAVFNAPEVSPIGVVYSESAEAKTSAGSEALAQTNVFSGVAASEEQTKAVQDTSANAPAQSTSRAASRATGKTSASSAAPLTGKININTASKEVLMQLDGIGETLAQRIIDYRTQHGGFDSIEELKQVKGIGDKRFEAIRNEITVG